MPLWWKALFVALIGLPFGLTLLFVTAAFWPRMDALTLRAPQPVRKAVAAAVIENTGYHTGVSTRVLALDPNNAEALRQGCVFLEPSGDYLATCERALAVNPSPGNYRGLGLAQEVSKQVCKAEASYRVASENWEIEGQRTYILNDLGRTALQCGHLEASMEAFRQAEHLNSEETDQTPDNKAYKQQLTFDRDYISIVYNRQHQPDKAKAECKLANPELVTTCVCSTGDKGMGCSDGKHDPTAFSIPRHP